jgi:riboflavin biosynthesis pyrimidine reductase
VYSASGDIDLALPVFNTVGVEVIVVTTESGAAALTARGATAKGIDIVADDIGTPEGMRRAHEALFGERGVRYLDCEGGATVLRALHGAGLLDELFVTVTDVVVDQARHAGIQKLWDIADAGAALVAEGRIDETSSWTFRRWRINER